MNVNVELDQSTHTWLITGVAGFIGSHLLEFLLKHKQKVIGLDNFVTGFRENLNEVLAKYPASDFNFIEGDIRDLSTCQKSMREVDYVLHQAALGSVPRSIKDPMATHEVNATGFLNMLIAAKEARIKRFVYASSSSVYGDSPILPKVETHQGNPLSPYAVSKMTNELYAKAFSNTYGLETIGLRYFNVFGERQNPNSQYSAVIPLWIKALIRNEAVYINGDGQTSRDFSYVANVVKANMLAALTLNQTALNTTYNIAAGTQVTLLQLHELLKKLLRREEHKPTYREFRKGDIHHSLADINKARKLLNYEPTHQVYEGLSEAIGWYEKNSV